MTKNPDGTITLTVEEYVDALNKAAQMQVDHNKDYVNHLIRLYDEQRTLNAALIDRTIAIQTEAFNATPDNPMTTVLATCKLARNTDFVAPTDAVIRALAHSMARQICSAIHFREFNQYEADKEALLKYRKDMEKDPEKITASEALTTYLQQK